MGEPEIVLSAPTTVSPLASLTRRIPCLRDGLHPPILAIYALARRFWFRLQSHSSHDLVQRVIIVTADSPPWDRFLRMPFLSISPQTVSLRSRKLCCCSFFSQRALLRRETTVLLFFLSAGALPASLAGRSLGSAPRKEHGREVLCAAISSARRPASTPCTDREPPHPLSHRLPHSRAASHVFSRRRAHRYSGLEQ